MASKPTTIKQQMIAHHAAGAEHLRLALRDLGMAAHNDNGTSPSEWLDRVEAAPEGTILAELRTKERFHADALEFLLSA